MRPSRWILLSLVAASWSLLGCDQSTPTPEGLCSRAAQCDKVQVLVAHDPCVQQVTASLTTAPEDCQTCALSLPCAGLASISSGAVTLDQICPSCPKENATTERCASSPHVLICGITPKAAASGSASGKAGKAPPGGSASAHPSASTSASAPPHPSASAPPVPPEVPGPVIVARPIGTWR